TNKILESNKDSSPQSANDIRKTEESKFFKDMYQKANFELDPMKNGEGPLQSLEKMAQEGKIQLSQEQMLSEANRIQSRDFKTLGRNFYTPADHVKLWTEDEIEKKVQGDVDKVKGIDVSNWQGTIDWKQVKNAGYQFAFMKATEGVDFVDHTFETFRKGARDAGLKEGYYHYFHPEESVAAQVKLFTDVIGKAEPDSLRLVIDAEDPGKWTPYPLAQRVKMVDDFLQGVKEKTGVTPQVSIYCSPNFADKILGNSPILSKYSLWIANYGVDKPTLPAPWGKWDFWQYTDAGKVPGINGKVDLDMFNGTDLSKAGLVATTANKTEAPAYGIAVSQAALTDGTSRIKAG
ncbi:MAG: glycoside hydrolase family 25 protein, partial [Candidatus Obscuribacterales bacterium]|nr:glycoside hydrolase family 25 protein [Candidatus Obscuribacterales bacterium]